MIRGPMVPRLKFLETNGADRLIRSAKAVRRRLPITRSTTRSPGSMRTRVDEGMQSSPATTLEVIESEAPRRR
jgi:hypothetical protein